LLWATLYQLVVVGGFLSVNPQPNDQLHSFFSNSHLTHSPSVLQYVCKQRVHCLTDLSQVSFGSHSWKLCQPSQQNSFISNILSGKVEPNHPTNKVYHFDGSLSISLWWVALLLMVKYNL
jgi:hypothetical protein